MGKIKTMKYFILFLIIVLTSCNNKYNKLNFKIVNNAYNVYISRDSTVVILKIYDKYGESNNLYLVKKDRTYKTTFDVDPIPFIDTIIDQRISLIYYSFIGSNQEKLRFKDKSVVNERQVISNYKIEYLRNNILNSSGLGESFYFDSLYFNESLLSVSFFLRNYHIRTYDIKELIFFENSFKVSEIETSEDNQIQYFTQFFPKNQHLVEKYYLDIYNYINKISK